MARLHEDEIDVDEELVRRLLRTVGTAYDDLPLRRFEATGSTNALFRLGDDLLVRVPRQPGGTATIEKEQRWLPYVAPHLPVPVPEVVAVGEPGSGYPEKWSVVRFLPGERPGVPRPNEPTRHALATDLAGVVRALGSLAVPTDARRDPSLEWYRGRPLASMDDAMQEYLRDSRPLAGHPGLEVDLGAVASAWLDIVQMPEAHRVVEPRWYHGDLNAENLLVRAGRLVAVLDFGGLSVGDPTIDLAVAWQLLDPRARTVFRESLSVDDVTWTLAAGWVLVLSVMGLPYYWDTMRDRVLRGLHAGREALTDLGLLSASCSRPGP
jgi:aminoglycoside phosphotransferase (APT) family kinase protein